MSTFDDSADRSSETGSDGPGALEELIAHYLDFLTSGQTLDRLQILADHPDLGPRILENLQEYIDLQAGSPAESELGTIGDYRLRRQIGRGGMGIVYEAWQTSMDRRVALKVLPAGVAADQRTFVRFLREARAAGKLNHPSVVPVYAMGVEGKTPYYAMELVEGETLEQSLSRKKKGGQGLEQMDLEQCMSLTRAFAEAADGLQHAHQNGITHRDLKPSNLILDREGRLRLLDFGLARLAGEDSLTLSGDLVGTPLYMSPEQAQARKVPIDHRTDIYSLGATLYEMLTWRPPFLGRNHQDTLSQIIERDPEPPRRLNVRVPRDLETIVLKCLCKEPAGRYGTAEALAQDLRRLARGDPIEARPQPRWERLVRRIWRRRTRVAMIAAAVLLATSSAVLIHDRYRQAERTAYERYRERVLRGCVKLELARMVVRAQGGESLGHDPVRLFTSGARRATPGGGLGPLERAFEDIQAAVAILPGRPDAHYHQARGFMLLGNEEEALEALDRADRAGAAVPAAVLRSQILEKRGDRTGALRERERARITRDRIWADAWQAARAAVEERRWEEAEGAYGKLIAMESGGRERYLGSTLEALLAQGSARIEAGRYVEAIEDFSVALALWPDLVEPLILKGKAYHLLGDASAAERIFEEAHARATFPDEVAQMMVVLYAGSFGRYQRVAIGNFDKALGWTERLREGLVKEILRGSCRYLQGKWPEAEAHARRAVGLDPDSALAHRLLGRALFREHRFEEALVELRKASEFDPLDPIAHDWAAFVLLRQGKPEESEREERRAIALDLGFSMAHSALSERLYEQGRLDESLAEAQTAVRLAPRFSDAHSGLSRLYARLGRREEAQKEFLAAQALDPENSDVYDDWGRTLEEDGEIDEAAEMYRKAVSLDLKRCGPWSHDGLSRIFAAKGNFEQAFLESCRAIEALPSYSEAHAALPGLFRRLGPTAAARSALDSLVEPLEALLERGEADSGVLKTLALARLHGQSKLDEPLALRHIQRAIEKGDAGSGAASILAEALWRAGRDAEAILALEGALASPTAKRYAAEQLEVYRRELLPDLVSYLSIDAALEFAGAETSGKKRLLDDFKSVAVGEGAERRLIYLEARLLEKEGRYAEASERLEELTARGEGSSLPVLRLAECLRALGDPEAAERELRRALEPGAGKTEMDRALWESWAVVSLVDLPGSPEELIGDFPGIGAGGYRADLLWLLEQLARRESVRILCGADDERNLGGVAWGRDRFYLSGETASFAANSRTERRFPREHFAPAGYRLPLPLGAYRVTIHFSENAFRQAGRRAFDVVVEGQTVLEAFEPGKAGFAVPSERSFEVEVEDGFLDIEFVHRLDNPNVNAIEIERAW